MEKQYSNNKKDIGILISKGYGAGWYSWNRQFTACLYDPEIIQLVLTDRHKLIPELALKKYGEDFFPDGYKDLVVEWIAVGTRFIVREHDGNEWIEKEDQMGWQVA